MAPLRWDGGWGGRGEEEGWRGKLGEVGESTLQCGKYSVEYWRVLGGGLLDCETLRVRASGRATVRSRRRDKMLSRGGEGEDDLE